MSAKITDPTDVIIRRMQRNYPPALLKWLLEAALIYLKRHPRAWETEPIESAELGEIIESLATPALRAARAEFRRAWLAEHTRPADVLKFPQRRSV